MGLSAPVRIPVKPVVEEIKINMEQDRPFFKIGQQRYFIVSYLVRTCDPIGNGHRVGDRVKANRWPPHLGSDNLVPLMSAHKPVPPSPLSRIICIT